MKLHIKTALAAATMVLSAQAMAQVTFYEAEGYRGRAFSTNTQVADFTRGGFNDRSSSVVVERGRWEICEHAAFGGRCVVLRRGSYDSLRALGMENTISSVRPITNNRRYENEPEPMAAADYQYRRRYNERVYDAQVTNVRAVMGAATERCWVERQQVSDSGGRNVAGTIAGALIGGVLGHQVGGGSGKDIATVGGAVAGGVIGSNMSQGNNYGSRDVRRCENTTSGTPAYWDVTYNFRGRDHQLQMSAAPGATIAVNGDGVPRQ
ncbi:beta/gamma crystallin-related protein [Ramlibacter sp. WS9]|uniref:beta/gamma crystallin-related protein n=1 Tax=Ramlibacter sp. WS9 TaxID=1882741 RepID=UPI0011416F28|nr:beta/gamma crystallin-related protein [Ramlibacter sp. WS9]ROZ79363.1 glycine zipper 2TM domain-containing protein [Ramlibacter sp. WS9]